MNTLDFMQLQATAERGMSPEAFAFLATGADDEITLSANETAWRDYAIRPRVLRDIQNIQTGTNVLGSPVASPIMVAPTGRHLLFHPEGERATARGCEKAGAAFVQATYSTLAMEDVAAEKRAAPQWFQLYHSPDRALNAELIDRAVQSGHRAIVLTVDQPTPGWSPRSARAPMPISDSVRHRNLPGNPHARMAYDDSNEGQVMFPATYRDLENLVRACPLDVVVKGILRGDEARRCVQAGAKAIIVSNHGGRHLDTAMPTALALPEIVDAVGRHAEVYVDGGIRRGTDILKALALGARAVLVGRPVLWGLASAGADGVRDVLLHLRRELIRAMMLAGVGDLDDMASDLVRYLGADSSLRVTSTRA